MSRVEDHEHDRRRPDERVEQRRLSGHQARKKELSQDQVRESETHKRRKPAEPGDRDHHEREGRRDHTQRQRALEVIELVSRPALTGNPDQNNVIPGRHSGPIDRIGNRHLGVLACLRALGQLDRQRRTCLIRVRPRAGLPSTRHLPNVGHGPGRERHPLDCILNGPFLHVIGDVPGPQPDKSDRRRDSSGHEDHGQDAQGIPPLVPLRSSRRAMRDRGMEVDWPIGGCHEP